MKVKSKRLFKAFALAIAFILAGAIVGTGLECMFELLEHFCGPVVELVARIVIAVTLAVYFAYVLLRDHEQERSEKKEGLMIGYWARDKKTKKQSQIRCNLYFADRYEPIEITSEILRKNDIDEYGRKSLGQIRIRRINSCGEFLLSINSTEGHLLKRIKYVHQLQQALRLCGIEKEITI